MEELIGQLRKELGLTEEQAFKAVAIMKNYMDKEGAKIDWNAYFSQKSEEFAHEAKGFISSLTQNTSEIVDKVDDIFDKARKKMHDLGEKASDIFDRK